MYIRSYKEEDAPILRDLFWNTVHTVNAVDYTMIQLDAWAPVEYDRNAWNQRFLDHTSFVVENDGHIVGFEDMDAQGYLDRLFVHKDHQNEGIGTMLCDALEALATKRVITQASITQSLFLSIELSMYTKTNSVCTRCGDGKLLDGKNHFIDRFYVRIA